MGRNPPIVKTQMPVFLGLSPANLTMLPSFPSSGTPYIARCFTLCKASSFPSGRRPLGIYALGLAM